MADNNQGRDTSSGTSLVREYRKGNWTVSETMILIEAKKMDDERRMKRSTGNDNTSGEGIIRVNKPTELRWKWVEDYCWRKGCLRSQNQCNDKWDNLMRDYKKVRDYERKLPQDQGQSSYWKMEKSERKDESLPTNMLPQLYEALVEVVEKRVASTISGSANTSVNVQYQASLMAPQALLARQHVSSPTPPSPITALPLPAPPPPTTVTAAPSPIQQVHPVLLYSQPILPTVDSDTSEHSDSPAKRRRKSTDRHERHPQEQGTTSASPRNVDATTLSSSSPSHELASAISRSATVIAEALLSGEDREERRHRELLSLHERRLKIEESKAEVNRQGINGLVDAINRLASSVQALASDTHHSPSSKPS